MTQLLITLDKPKNKNKKFKAWFTNKTKYNRNFIEEKKNRCKKAALLFVDFLSLFSQHVVHGETDAGGVFLLLHQRRLHRGTLVHFRIQIDTEISSARCRA